MYTSYFQKSRKTAYRHRIALHYTFGERINVMGYLFLGLAILLEFIGTTCMKLSDGFSHIPYAIGTLASYGVCFYCFALSLKTVQLNIAYATWGGLGVVLSALGSYYYFHESISTLGLIGIVLIIAGVILCNFFGAGHS